MYLHVFDYTLPKGFFSCNRHIHTHTHTASPIRMFELLEGPPVAASINDKSWNLRLVI
jgi:hypothetical protein